MPKARPPKGNPVGRPERIPTPHELEFISRSRLKCRSWREIADALGAEQSTIINWFRLKIEPLWKANTGRQAHQEIARLDEIERICWERFAEETAGVPELKALRELKLSAEQIKAVQKMIPKGVTVGQAWLSIILKVIDFRCKIRGDYAPTQIQGSIDTGYRVAGSTPAEESNRMMQRLVSAVESRVKFEAALKAAVGSNN